MKSLYAILILLSVIITQSKSQKLCNNGVFKCVSPTSLRICFLDKLVTSEFSCPYETFCNENSPTICTKIPNALPGIIYDDELTTTTEEYPEIQCPETGIFNVENTGCTTYLNCSNLEDALEEECNEVSLFNPETTTCSEDYICPENLDYVKTYEDCSQSENTFICPKVGNFPLPNTNCQKYIYCKQIYIGLKAILKFCPKGTLFDPSYGKCVQGHVCYDECVTTTTTEEITTTTTEKITTTTEEDIPKCISVGKFPIPNTNCTMYRFCALLNNDFVHQDRTCPSNSYFDPSRKLCSRFYECFPSITAEPETTTPNNSPSPNDDDNTTTTLSSDVTEESPSSSSEVTDLSSTSVNTVSDETPNPNDDTTIPNSSPSDNTDLPSTLTNIVTEETTPNPNDEETTTPPSQNSISTEITTEITEETPNPNDDTTTTTLNSIITEETPEESSSSSIATDFPSTPTNIITEETTSYTNDAETTTTTLNSISTEMTEGSSSEVTGLPSTITTTLKPDDGTDNCVIPEEDSSISSISTDGNSITPEVTESSNSLEVTDSPNTPTNTVTEETTPNANDDETTTTTLNSISTEETTPFAIDCRSQGRLPIPNTNCLMYYQCTLTTNGYTYKTYECSRGTLFDPYRKQCLKTYTCPETISTTSTQFPDLDNSDEEIDLLNCTESGRVPVPNTDCMFYGQCILTTNGFIQTIYECPPGTLFDIERRICSHSYVCPGTTNSGEITTTESPVAFCTQQGKFPLVNTKCKNYLSCILTTNGFITNEYACSGDLLFDPVLKKCSSSYICPEEQSYIPLIHETYPDCDENGKFPVPQSKCSQYILCSSTQNGFISKVYSCPNNTYFNPENKKCSQMYSCPEIEPEPEIIPECHETGKFLIENSECSKYILCSLTSTGFRSKIYYCPVDSYFNPESKRCQKDYICPEISDLETTTELGIITTTEDLSSEEQTTECINVMRDIPVCVKQGKFPIPGKDCKEYILCTLTSSGFVSKIYECPVNSNFDPDRKKCTITYSCQEKICETKIAKLQKPKITKCKYPGKFPVKGTHCQKFKLCVWTNPGYTKTVYDCPDGTYFNPRLQQCSPNYFCSEGIQYNCTTVGLFKDHTDLTCEYYISCKIQGDGTVRGERKICPVNLYFDPVRQRCSSQYFCKIRSSRMIEATPKFLINGQCTTVGRYAITGTNCKNYMYCADNGDGTLKGTVFTCPTTSVFNQAIQKCAATFICPDSVCRFPGLAENPNSKDCTSYIQCEDVFDQNGLIVGSTGRVVYCPIGQKYNPTMQCCSWTYVCPK